MSPNAESEIEPLDNEQPPAVDPNEVDSTLDGVSRRLSEETARADRLEAELLAERERSDEVMEKIVYLRRACLDLSLDELRQKLTAVGPAEWSRGIYWNPLVEEWRKLYLSAKENGREVARQLAELQSDCEENWKQ